jgi:Fibronectin type III domain
MKSFCVFILGLILTVNFAQAADTTHATDAHAKKGKNKDWTHTRLEQVAEVLPQPIQDKSKTDKPEVVKLTSPKFLSKIDGATVKLEWTKSENAKVYHIQVSKDAGFNNRSMYVVNNNAVADTSFEVKDLEPNTKYFWRVAAFNNDMKESYTKSNFTSSSFTTK